MQVRVLPPPIYGGVAEWYLDIPPHRDMLVSMPSFHRLDPKVGELVLERCGYKCTKCGETEDICVHHIERMKSSDPRYNDDKYLTVLCRVCHFSFHRRAGHVTPPKPTVNKWGRRGKGNLPVVCKIEGCKNMQHGKSLCKKHYEYYRRKGWVGLPS